MKFEHAEAIPDLWLSILKKFVIKKIKILMDLKSSLPFALLLAPHSWDKSASIHSPGSQAQSSVCFSLAPSRFWRKATTPSCHLLPPVAKGPSSSLAHGGQENPGAPTSGLRSSATLEKKALLCLLGQGKGAWTLSVWVGDKWLISVLSVRW